MALRDDLATIQRTSLNALTLLDLKDTATSASIDASRDQDGSLSITLTPAQKQQLKDNFTNLIAQIKVAAGRLP